MTQGQFPGSEGRGSIEIGGGVERGTRFGARMTKRAFCPEGDPGTEAFQAGHRAVGVRRLVKVDPSPGSSRGIAARG